MRKFVGAEIAAAYWECFRGENCALPAQHGESLSAFFGAALCILKTEESAFF